ncbi:hypothetical protein ACX0G7_20290 [Flavitalea antarctica]
MTFWRKPKRRLDIAVWLEWCPNCLNTVLLTAFDILAKVIKKGKVSEKPTESTLNERQRLMIDKMLNGFEVEIEVLEMGKNRHVF